MLKKNEPDWIKHDGSSECPVPAGHDVERKYWPDDHNPSRSNKPEMANWVYITHYRDWTAFEQQQASAEVPKLLTEAGLRKILKEEGGVAGWRQDRIVRGFKARALLAPEPEPDALREVAEELARESQDLNLPLRKRVDWFVAQLRARGVTAPAPAR